MEGLFGIIVFSGMALMVTLILRHFFNMKFPEVDSSYIILLPIAQIACMAAYFTCFYGLMVAVSTDNLLGTQNVSVSNTEDSLLGIHALFTVVGSVIMVVTVPLLLYHTFNFPKCKSKRLKILANINTICVLTTDVSGIIAYASFSETMLCIVFLLMFLSILFFQIKYQHSATEIYRSKYSDSIQSMVVKSLTQLAPEKKEVTKRCPYCGEEILAVAKKCRYCGEWLNKETIKCPVCGEEIDKESTVCPYCKEPINK
jgi:predicted RNA-binding Zn-ribbon protein involved in translation (DUF1610 family)